MLVRWYLYQVLWRIDDRSWKLIILGGLLLHDMMNLISWLAPCSRRLLQLLQALRRIEIGVDCGFVLPEPRDPFDGTAVVSDQPFCDFSCDIISLLRSARRSLWNERRGLKSRELPDSCFRLVGQVIGSS